MSVSCSWAVFTLGSGAVRIEPWASCMNEVGSLPTELRPQLKLLSVGGQELPSIDLPLPSRVLGLGVSPAGIYSVLGANPRPCVRVLTQAFSLGGTQIYHIVTVHSC